MTGARARGLRLVHDGEEYAVLELNPSFREDETSKESSPPSGLSRAEADVLTHLTRGLSNAEIARARGTSVRTVANQVQKLYTKFDVSSRVELVAKLASLGATDAPRRRKPSDADK